MTIDRATSTLDALLNPDRWLERTADDRWPSWRTITQRYGMFGVEQVATVGPVPCPEPVSTRLAVHTGDQVLLRRVALLLRGEPAALVDRWYDWPLVAMTDLTKEPAHGPVVAYDVLDRVGVAPVKMLPAETVIRASVRETYVTAVAVGGQPVEVARIVTGFDPRG